MQSQQNYKLKVENNPIIGLMQSSLLIMCLFLSFFIGTEYIAFHTDHPGIYQPFLGLVWSFQAATHGIKDIVYLTGLRISMIFLVFSFLLVNVFTSKIRRKIKGTDIHGSAKWASEEDLRKANLLDQDNGLYIGGWENKRTKTIEYLKDNTESHAIAVAPTGSGKGVGFVIPNLLSWTGSVIVFDLKGENYLLTSGYRKQELKQNVIVFNPTNNDQIIVKEEIEQAGLVWSNFVEKMTQPGCAEQVDSTRVKLNEDLSVIKNRLAELFPKDINKILAVLQSQHSGSCAAWNPLEEIRMGAQEVKDTQLIVEMLIDPYGKGDLDHWHRAAKSLLTGIILHVLYARKDKTLSGVVDLLSDTKRPIWAVLDSMLMTEHDPEGIYGWIDKSTGRATKINPVISAVAREMKNKQFEELSGIVSTAMSFLTLYRDPILARNTSKSDFTISDIITGDKPMSFYFIAPPSDLQRIIPLMRLFINLCCSRLMEKSKMIRRNNKSKSHELLLMLDEFPALGKMDALKTALTFMRGYGLRAFLICQELDQLYEIYGDKNPILGQCNIRIAYAPNTEGTARKISALAGETTVVKYTKSYSESKSGQSSEGASEIKRSLILPDEVLHLPDTDMLIFAGRNSIYGKKIVYYKDPWFSKMSEIRPVPISVRVSSKNDFLSITKVVEYERPIFADFSNKEESKFISEAMGHNGNYKKQNNLGFKKAP